MAEKISKTARASLGRRGERGGSPKLPHLRRRNGGDQGRPLQRKPKWHVLGLLQGRLPRQDALGEGVQGARGPIANVTQSAWRHHSYRSCSGPKSPRDRLREVAPDRQTR